LTSDQKQRFFEAVNRRTLPIRPHEATIVRDILQASFPQDGWRSLQHVFCNGCRRELTPLDYFLTSIRHHSPDFLRNQIETRRASNEERHSIEIVDHPISITCSNCGLSRDLSNNASECIYLYRHPKLPNLGTDGWPLDDSITRVSQQNFDAIMRELGGA